VKPHLRWWAAVGGRVAQLVLPESYELGLVIAFMEARFTFVIHALAPTLLLFRRPKRKTLAPTNPMSSLRSYSATRGPSSFRA
jgi:hypothetical protein